MGGRTREQGSMQGEEEERKERSEIGIKGKREGEGKRKENNGERIGGDGRED